jgi:hypothetical protein
MDGAGRVAFFTQTETDLIADVQGYYTPAVASRAGRLVALTPARVLDTRAANPIAFGPVLAGQSVDIDFRPWGVAPDAIAVVLNVTVTEATAPGYWTAFATGTTRPVASNLNVIEAGQTVPNQVITPLSEGRATIFSQSGGHLIVDISGYYTGASSARGSSGLFVPVTPYRLLDTRNHSVDPGVKTAANSQVSVWVSGLGGVTASSEAAVVINATVTDTNGPGFFSVWPSGTTRPTISNLNAAHVGQTIANHVITPVTQHGFDFYTQSGADLIADITGYFLGPFADAAPYPEPPAVPDPGPNGPPDVGNYVFSFASTPTNTIVYGQADPANIPFHWDKCQSALRYAINMNGYDEKYRAVIADDIARVATATGIAFTYVGDTSFIPQSSDPYGYPLSQFANGSTPYDLLISLSDDGITDLLPGSLGGITYPNWIYNTGKDGRLDVATISMDMANLDYRQPWAGDGLGPVLLHELGHAMGINHVTDTSQIMYPGAVPNGPQTYASGDLRGLWLVGQGAAHSCNNF